MAKELLAEVLAPATHQAVNKPEGEAAHALCRCKLQLQHHVHRISVQASSAVGTRENKRVLISSLLLRFVIVLPVHRIHVVRL